MNDLLRFVWSLVGVLVLLVLAPHAWRVIEPHLPAALRFWQRVHRPVLLAVGALVVIAVAGLFVGEMERRQRDREWLAEIADEEVNSQLRAAARDRFAERRRRKALGPSNAPAVAP